MCVWWTAWKVLCVGLPLMACPQIVVQLYKGHMKVYTYQTNILKGSTAVVEHKDKDQGAGLEIAGLHPVWPSGLQGPNKKHCRVCAL
jgi:hypothetical protein